jgi:hypothetical protein
LDDIILVIVFLEHMCFIVLRVTGTKDQKIERFLGTRKPTRLLVCWEDDYIDPLWESRKTFGKIMLGSGRTALQMIGFNIPGEEVFFLIYICYVSAIPFKE